ncbi:MAG: bifunctional nuclease family protein [Bacteroidetes bacterium]|nr:bifunctional nuclease family protein [Bacteroidota bacterium]MBL6944050.1 bifunctional nuclease family protein [Bacteroidales bacterium]
MKKVKLEIVGMSYSQSQSGAYALILGIPGQKKRLPIIIGGSEAQAIAIELEKMKPSRPLTHDLFTNFANHFGIRVTEVIINKFEEGIFFSRLVCEHNGAESEIDSRTSDAVAIALRFKCPIYAYQSIIDEAGIVLEDHPIGEDPEGTKSTPEHEDIESDYSDYLLEELEDLIKKAIENENYEKASKIRDEIKRRKK